MAVDAHPVLQVCKTAADACSGHVELFSRIVASSTSHQSSVRGALGDQRDPALLRSMGNSYSSNSALPALQVRLLDILYCEGPGQWCLVPVGGMLLAAALPYAAALHADLF